jgi:N-acetylglucosaminyldiphosphoundecaprenol N-acetyl-beta-D-mannosaminyltransferase
VIDRGKQNILGIRIDAVDYEAAVARIIAAARRRSPLSVSALAVHGVMTGALDRVHRYRLNHMDLVVPDGQPVRWALNALHGAKLRDRVYGPTLMLRICEAAQDAGLPIFLFGASADTLRELSKNLHARFLKLSIAGMRPSRFRRLEYDELQGTIAEIQQSGAALLFVGLGCPRQEVWAFELREALNIPIIAVGAAFNFHSGSLAQAPRLMQDYGLEWCFRLWREPRRLWKRYLVLNPLYATLVLLQAAGLKRFDPNDSDKPVELLSYG